MAIPDVLAVVVGLQFKYPDCPCRTKGANNNMSTAPLSKDSEASTVQFIRQWQIDIDLVLHITLIANRILPCAASVRGSPYVPLSAPQDTVGSDCHHPLLSF